MKIGEKDLPLSQHGPLTGLRFLDLHNHVSLGKNFSRIRGNGGAGLPVSDIICNNARTSARFDNDVMTAGDEYYYPGASSSDLPVVRVTAPDDTRFYLDPDTGALRFIADDSYDEARRIDQLLASDRVRRDLAPRDED